MAKESIKAMEAAAAWGCADNSGYTLEQRLKFALEALEFFGNAYDLDECRTIG